MSLNKRSQRLLRVSRDITTCGTDTVTVLELLLELLLLFLFLLLSLLLLSPGGGPCKPAKGSWSLPLCDSASRSSPEDDRAGVVAGASGGTGRDRAPVVLLVVDASLLEDPVYSIGLVLAVVLEVSAG